jgi:nucleotidyltransferase substrate binding protein (TIGR01987 family)
MKSKSDNLRDQLKSAFLRFQDVMRQEKNEFIRDSAIQRFEFTYELAWKTMKSLLAERGASDLNFPRDVIKSAFQAGLIDNDPGWLEMIKTRNETSHLYNEGMAETVYGKLAAYLPLIDQLLKKIS